MENGADPEIEASITGGDVLVQALFMEGIEYVFGIPGGEFIPFFEALDRWGPDHGMHYINVRHEQAAGHMADAYARVKGKPAVACGTVGPGFLHLLPGIAPAWADNVPMIVVHPQQDLKFEDLNRLQGGVDQLAMARPIVRYQKHVSDPNRIALAVQKCFKELYGRCPGPVELEIREDALAALVDPFGAKLLPPWRYRCTEPPAANPASIKKACDLLVKCSRPLIISGGGVTASNRWDLLQTLSITYNIPVVTTVMGIGTMSTEHHTYLGATLGGAAALKAAHEADLFLALGTKFSFTMGYGKPPIWNPDAKLIQVDIDPQALGKNRPIDAGIIGDCGVVLGQILDELDTRQTGQIFEPGWNSSLRREREVALAASVSKFASEKVPIEPRRLIADLTAVMGSDDILVVDGGDIAVMTIADIDAVKPRSPRTVVQSIGLGLLGTCIPYAIGAKLAAPDKRVFAITGDGSFLFNVQELDTAMKYDVPFVCVVADNSCWGMIKNMEKEQYKDREPFCVDLQSDYAKIAKGFGCYAERVDVPAEIVPALQRAVESGKPSVIHVPIRFVTPPGGAMLRAFRELKF
jgi:acetolactate synthase-1/2/3 large subunit